MRFILASADIGLSLREIQGASAEDRARKSFAETTLRVKFFTMKTLR